MTSRNHKENEMSKITEIFILKMKEGDEVDAIREAARADFVALEGVTSWETLVTTDQSRDTLYADIFTFPDHETAKRVTPQFCGAPGNAGLPWPDRRNDRRSVFCNPPTQNIGVIQ